MIIGVDVHAGYGAIDWPVVAGAGVDFAIVKCTLGNEPQGDDRTYQRNVAGARAAGLVVGMYHFAYPLRSGPGLPAGRSPREQAERAFQVSGGLGAAPGELPPALDLEWPPHYERDKTSGRLIDRWQEWGITAESIAEWALEWLETATVLWGRVPLLYTYPDFWRSLGAAGAQEAFGRSPLWMATYPASAHAAWSPPDGAAPVVPPPWDDWTMWQFAAEGSTVRIPGIPACPIDRDCIRSREALERLAGMSAPPAADFEIVHPLPKSENTS